MLAQTCCSPMKSAIPSMLQPCTNQAGQPYKNIWRPTCRHHVPVNEPCGLLCACFTPPPSTRGIQQALRQKHPGYPTANDKATLCRSARRRKKARTLQLHKKPAGSFYEGSETNRSDGSWTPGRGPMSPPEEGRPPRLAPAAGLPHQSHKPALKKLPVLQIVQPVAGRLPQVRIQ